MQVLGIVLLLVSIGCIVGPVGAVAFDYRNNLVQMVVPSQINNLMSQISDNTNSNGNSGQNGLVNPVLVSAQINQDERTFVVIVNVTNNFDYNFTLNSFNTTVESNQDNTQLATISLASPVTMLSGQTEQVTVSGAWTQEAENYVTNNLGGASSIDVNLVNTAVDVNGIVIQQLQPINVGDVPLSYGGN